MVVLGVDPGYATLGFGVIEFDDISFKTLDFGVVCTPADVAFENRLEDIYSSLEEIFASYKIDVLSIEKLFFQNNQKTAINVAQARGVILLASKKAQADIFEYTPLQVKSLITGSGRAPKLQVMQVIKRLLKLKTLPKFDDTADALALALCHVQSVRGFMKV